MYSANATRGKAPRPTLIDHRITNPKTLEAAKRIRVLLLDSDGVLNTGQVIEGIEGKPRLRNFVDGQGVSWLRAHGIRVAILTNESGKSSNPAAQIVEKWNGLPSCMNGNWEPVKFFTDVGREEKVAAAEDWIKELGVSWAECAHMGDDVSDYDLLLKVGLPACPAQAEFFIKKICTFHAERTGGNGAIRDLCNLILEAQNADIRDLAIK